MAVRYVGPLNADGTRGEEHGVDGAQSARASYLKGVSNGEAVIFCSSWLKMDGLPLHQDSEQ